MTEMLKREGAREGEQVLGTAYQVLRIEKGVTGPAHIYWSRGLCAVLRQMAEVGDSVLVPRTDAKASQAMSTRVAQLRRRMAADGVVRRWAVRRVEGGVRIWRVE